MTPATLNRVGTALYGPLWQTQLARALGINDRTVRRFVSGDMEIPDKLNNELCMLIIERREQLLAELNRLLAIADEQVL